LESLANAYHDHVKIHNADIRAHLALAQIREQQAGLPGENRLEKLRWAKDSYLQVVKLVEDKQPEHWAGQIGAARIEEFEGDSASAMRRYETILKVQGGNEVLSGLASEGMERIWLQSPGSTGRISQAYQEEKTSILAHLKETEEKEGAVIEGLPAAGSQEEDRLAHVAMGIGHPSKKAVNFVIEESIL
jgi:hypothetical protein